MEDYELKTILEQCRLYEFYTEETGGSFFAGRPVYLYEDDTLISKLGPSGENNGLLALDNEDIIYVRYGTEYLTGAADTEMKEPEMDAGSYDSAKEAVLSYAAANMLFTELTFYSGPAGSVSGRLVGFDDDIISVEETGADGKPCGVCCTSIDNVLACSCEWK